MSYNPHLVDQPVFLRAYLTDPSTGDPDDPATQDPVDDSTVAMTVYIPDGTTESPSLTHVSTGTYEGQFTPAIPGQYQYYTLSTGMAAGRGKGRFWVADVPDVL